jgi:hypothetical protein
MIFPESKLAFTKENQKRGFLIFKVRMSDGFHGSHGIKSARGLVLNPRDCSLIRPEMFRYLGLRDGAGLAQLLQASDSFPAFHRPILKHFAEFACRHTGIMP